MMITKFIPMSAAVDAFSVLRDGTNHNSALAQASRSKTFNADTALLKEWAQRIGIQLVGDNGKKSLLGKKKLSDSNDFKEALKLRNKILNRNKQLNQKDDLGLYKMSGQNNDLQDLEGNSVHKMKDSRLQWLLDQYKNGALQRELSLALQREKDLKAQADWNDLMNDAEMNWA